jgi:hypothetical protein
MVLTGLLSGALLIAAAVTGVAGFDAYPRVEMDADAATFALGASLALLPLVPFLSPRARNARPEGAG